MGTLSYTVRRSSSDVLQSYDTDLSITYVKWGLYDKAVYFFSWEIVIIFRQKCTVLKNKWLKQFQKKEANFVHPRWTVHKKEINRNYFDLKNGHFHSHFHKPLLIDYWLYYDNKLTINLFCYHNNKLNTFEKSCISERFTFSNKKNFLLIYL